ncbi:MAG: hypothetical protein U0836_17980 [Pirellulales bacterium]
MDISNSTNVPPVDAGNFFISPPTAEPRLTWERLCEMQPALDDLARFATNVGHTERSWVWIKTRLACLIGWDSPAWRHPVLGSSRAWEVATMTLRGIWERSVASSPKRRRAGR